ncbi:DUF4157 domain-containing protein [Kitasatospora acidiphila]|uniref:DUF4157 domain-containing protein n=1 Tax=Kitasatospora acidiphila TaxID=2567942 RepID=A0A540WD20_9ACTN|nr:DUF4157 domain-containing protein [Kitasatospora acidiphila]TQF06842.1 DUF4157 domain-containing protein [Kitasatospora acidiphila]
MGDEKAPDQPRVKKTDKPPMPTTQPAPKDQQAGPAKAAEQTPPASGEQTPHQATPAGQTAALQQAVGNQQANRLMRAAREPDKDPHTPAGVKVSHPDDAHEKEAEAVAKHVTSGADPTHSHGTAAKTAPSGGAPGDPPKIAGDPELTHRAIAPHTAPAQPHPDTPQHGAATQHPATQVAATQHPGPAGPNPAAILDHPGPGQPLPQPTRGILEARLKTDLSHVVVHHDAAADQAVRALHARAVTRGNHIFLASDASPTDLSLMAHEVTHVLHHQGGVVHRQADSSGTAQDTTPAPYDDFSDGEGALGRVDYAPSNDNDGDEKKTIEVAKVLYSKLKLNKDKTGVDAESLFKGSPRIVPPKRGSTSQDSIWPNRIKNDAAATTKKIGDLIKKNPARIPPDATDPADPLYLLRFGPGGPTTDSATAETLQGVIIGTKEDLITTALQPYWDQTGKFNPMNIDHVVEVQVAGKQATDKFENYWLWEAVANQSGGGKLRSAITTSVNDLLAAARKAHATQRKPGPPPPANRTAAVNAGWRIKIRNLVEGLEEPLGSPDAHWSRQEVAEGKPADKLTIVSEAEAEKLKLIRSNERFLTIVLGGKSGGTFVRVEWPAGTISKPKDELKNVFDHIYPHFTVTRVRYDEKNPDADANRLYGTVTHKDVDETKNISTKLTGFKQQPGGGPYARLNEQNLAPKVGFFHYKALSQIDITQASLIPFVGFSALGVLKPSVPLLRGTPIDVTFQDGDITFEKSFGVRNLPVPAPIKLTSGGITVHAGTDGFGVQGTLDLALGTVATGSISASVDTNRAFTLDGQLDFDKTLFQPASLGFTYRKSGSSDYSWGINGNLGIPAGKVPGVKGAHVNVSYADSKFAIDGSADLSIPGLQNGSLAITYADKTGLTIGGTLAFAPSAFIESGSVSATVTKQPPNHWSVAASGTVKPKIPGINTTLNASYHDGIYTIEGTVAYARGMLAGSLTVGLTNQPLGTDGRPDAGPPKPGAPKAGGAPQASGPLHPYGSGTLTAKITPWLQGTAGVQIQKDGSVQLMGEIKLPDSIDLFKAIEVQKNILNVGIKIPIVGVSVLGQSIGIFADVSGGLDASAGVGPGQLNKLGLKVQYNPEHEDQTQITGTAQLDIPAHAGLRLYVNGGIGAGIPVVSAEAGLQITGQLGLQTLVQAGVTVNWTPKKGLVIDAQASLTASPTFTFGINGYVKVTADLWFDTVNLYEKHWQLASVQYGSGLQIGVTAPIHYEEGKPFSFSPSDVKFQLPNIDPTSILTDLVHKIV